MACLIRPPNIRQSQRVLGRLPKPCGKTHIPRTSVSPEENTHFPRTSHSHYMWRPQGFGSLPNSRPGVGKLPTRQLQSSLPSTSLVLLYTQLGRVSLIVIRSHPHTPDSNTHCVRPAGTGSQSLFISVIDHPHCLQCV